MDMPPHNKVARIDLRITPTQKALIEQAAAAQGRTLSEFMVGASTAAAHLALADQNRFVLTDEQMARFLQRLDEEPTEIAGLRELFARKSVFD